MSDVATKTSNATGFSGAEYNDVALGSQLEAINMLSTKFESSPEAFGDLERMKLAYNIKTLSCTHNTEENFVAAIFQYEVEGKSGRKKAFKCVADYAVLYTVPESAKREAAIGFCRNVGKYAAYAYFRALVSQLSWGAGLKLPPLPSIASTAHIPKKKAVTTVEGNVA